jgi:hypothetical protein
MNYLEFQFQTKKSKKNRVWGYSRFGLVEAISAFNEPRFHLLFLNSWSNYFPATSIIFACLIALKSGYEGELRGDLEIYEG